MKSAEGLQRVAAESVQFELERAERDAHSRFVRVCRNFADSFVTQAAEGLWREAADAVRAHRTKMRDAS